MVVPAWVRRRARKKPRASLARQIRGGMGRAAGAVIATLSHGEHVISAAEVDRMGGQDAAYEFRRAIHQYNDRIMANVGQFEKDDVLRLLAEDGFDQLDAETAARVFYLRADIKPGGQTVHGIVKILRIATRDMSWEAKCRFLDEWFSRDAMRVAVALIERWPK